MIDWSPDKATNWPILSFARKQNLVKVKTLNFQRMAEIIDETSYDIFEWFPILVCQNSKLKIEVKSNNDIFIQNLLKLCSL